MSELTDVKLKQIEEEVLEQMDKYGQGSLYNKVGRKKQYSFFFDDVDGKKCRKTLSILDGQTPEEVKYNFIKNVAMEKYKNNHSCIELQLVGNVIQTLPPELANHFLEMFLNSIQSGNSNAVKPSSMTVNKLFDEYLNFCKKDGLSHCTISSRSAQLNKLRPYIGFIPAYHLNLDDVQNTIYSISTTSAGDPLSYSYINSIKKSLRSALKYAKKQKYIASLDFMDEVVLPKNLKPLDSEKRFITYENLARILYVLSSNNYYYYVVLTMILTGVRPQEVVTICMDDIDFENGRIYIKQAAILNDKRKIGYELYTIGKTKTPESKRFVPAPKMLLDELKSWIDYYKSTYHYVLAKKNNNQDLLFTNKKGNVINLHIMLSCIQTKIKKYKIDDVYFTLDGCRHCFATLLDRELCPTDRIDLCLGHTLKTDVLHKHYIATSLDYLDDVAPYLEKVCGKLLDAINNYDHASEQAKRLNPDDLIDYKDWDKYF